MNNNWLSAPLTRGELAWIKRREAGLSQSAFRADKGLTRGEVLRAEADVARDGTSVTDLSWPQRLRLARRRSGLERSVIAAALGVTAMTLHNWERAGDERLIQYWRRLDAQPVKGLGPARRSVTA